MYRILFFLALIVAVFAVVPAEVTAQYSCYVCDFDTHKCDKVGEPGVNEGCAGDGGTVICRNGECSDDCENHEGHCQIVYATLESFGVTADQEVIFDDEAQGRVAVLPLPGYEDLWGRWACTGKLVEVYRQTGDRFELVPGDVSSYELATVQ